MPLSITERRTTCATAPVQIEGTLSNGQFFYFRARHTGISLGIGATPDEAVENTVIAVGLAQQGAIPVGPHEWSHLAQPDLVLEALLSLLP
ncbi:hypothetical protein [Kineosporia succinea]|uniref:Uncharacterized protein n=1 Tax=Kineosporia succinea TaxID=84632 RepID=A0ABT9P798_9ACTN|nr:hypothetical protein [Kineosporia succinea]MDP9828060.1 hypothetical protein [Kineosporia succinea]